MAFREKNVAFGSVPGIKRRARETERGDTVGRLVPVRTVTTHTTNLVDTSQSIIFNTALFSFRQKKH
jgi:hypothetical protein